MKKTYLIILLIISAFNFSEAQSYLIKGKVIYQEKNEPLVGVNVYSINSDSTIAGTVTDSDGRFELKLGYKPKTINVTCIGLASKEIEAKFDDNNEMILNTFLEDVKLILEWEKESIEYNSELTGKWEIKRFTSNGKKSRKIPKKLKNRYFFIFDTEEYDSFSYGKFIFPEGCKKHAIESYFRFTNTDELELRHNNIPTEMILLLCRYKKKKHQKIYYEYRKLMGSVMDNIVHYKLNNGELYIRSEHSELILKKSTHVGN